MTASRIMRRTAVAASAVVVALAVPATASTPVRSAPPQTAGSAAAGRGGNPASAIDHVADFYGAYVDVLHDSGRTRLSDALRGHYLTPAFRAELARWESHHHTDGVLRHKGVPQSWQVTYNDSGMGHCWTRVKLTWKDHRHGVHHTRLMVQSDLATRLISGIRTGS